ncbi:MAG: ATP-binding cassette domain-containing protein, partial [Saprospiraceae bacterium]|nr:ATP-binding cassette domain-containing protein [Saprospiraceae bacterium]
MKELVVLNKYFLRYKWHLLFGIIFVSLSNYFRVLQPQIIRDALDLVIENIGIYNITEGTDIQQSINKELAETLLFFGATVLVLALIMGIFMYFMRQTIIVMSRLIEYDLRKDIFSHYEELDLGFYKKNNTGDLMARISEDVSKVRMYLGPALLYGINLVSLFILAIYSMVKVNLNLTLWVLAPLPILSISIYYVSNLINKKSTIIQTQLSKLNSIAQEVYSGIRVVKSYVHEKPMAHYYEDECGDYRTKSLELARVNAFFHPLMIVLIGTSTLLVLIVGGIQVSKGLITPGNIAEFIIYVNMLTWPVTALGWISSLIQQAAASQKRINEFMHTVPAIQNQNTDQYLIKGGITFSQVGFTYRDTGIQALEDISFMLGPGEKMAIVGRTGSGKSTLADLIVRMYDVDKGSIKIDGMDIRYHNLQELRKQIGYVTQDVFLFSDTVAKNIAFSASEATQTEIEQNAEHAAIHTELKRLPEGY